MVAQLLQVMYRASDGFGCDGTTSQPSAGVVELNPVADSSRWESRIYKAWPVLALLMVTVAMQAYANKV